MKFKVGDIVKTKSLEKIKTIKLDPKFDPVFVDSMNDLCGQTSIVSRISEKDRFVSVMNWWWSYEWVDIPLKEKLDILLGE